MTYISECKYWGCLHIVENILVFKGMVDLAFSKKEFSLKNTNSLIFSKIYLYVNKVAQNMYC